MTQNFDRLQQAIEKYYHRNKGIMDTLSKLSISVAKTQRSVIKSATQCGCTEIFAIKQPPDLEREAESMLIGCVCPSCREIIEKNLGDTLFYFLSLVQLTGTNFDSLIESQLHQTEWLGKFNLK
ncbi:MAG: DUF1573 domain-containing protein [Clostridia bacterium]|nr:DUF1573 domain-containing protein [Clostridia bacterium]